jgi:hypothetical protein
MRPGLGGDPLIAEVIRKRATYGVNASYSNPAMLLALGFEIAGAGLYRMGLEFNIQAPGNNGQNEFSVFLSLDGMILRPRTCCGMYNSVVSSRDHHYREHIVYLSEGGHYLVALAYTIGTDAAVLSDYFLEGERLWVERV